MTDSAPPQSGVECPACSAPLPMDEGSLRCRRCRADVHVAVFRPVLDAAALDAGEGRCINHHGKDAVDACGRCGGYVCDVCVTRTGEDVLCPACFDVLHERGELATTRTRRIRWDQMCVTCLLVLMLGCWPATPLALLVAVYALWRRRTEPWLSIWPSVATILILLGPGVLILLAVFSRAS